MQSKGSSNRLSGMVFRSRISTLLLSMFATLASFYVAGRLWQDAENRVYLAKELDRITGQHDEQGNCEIKHKRICYYVKLIEDPQLGQSAISVDDTLKIIACREQQKKLPALQMELAAARQEGFVSKHLPDTKKPPKKQPLFVIGVLTSFGRKNNRDAIRKAWMATALTKMEEEKGIIPRFVIGRSPNRGDSMDQAIDRENRQTGDFIILEDHVEALEELPKKTKSFFAVAAEKWEADFYAKVNDDVYVNIDLLANVLATHMDKPRVYIGCMKSGEVFSEQSHKWYEPDWWKFGDGKTYFRHASGEMFLISKALAKFVSINRSILRTYAHDDISTGSWFIGLDVKHIDERKFCCSSWSTGAICAGI